MSPPPLFSVVTVVYNDLRGLRVTEASLRCQTCRDFEWIVVDGGSSDGTPAYLAACQGLPLHWVSEPDRGIYDAMNKATARATGRYVNYLNAGDTYAGADALASAEAALLGGNWPELLYGGASYQFPDGYRRDRPPRNLTTAIRHGLPGMHQSTFYRREFLEVPPYDLRYRVSSDYYISARCFIRGARAEYLDRSLVDFEVGGRSMQQHYTSIRECWSLQRDVLQLGTGSRLTSAARRWLSFQVLLYLFHVAHRHK